MELEVCAVRKIDSKHVESLSACFFLYTANNFTHAKVFVFYRLAYGGRRLPAKARSNLLRGSRSIAANFCS